MSMLAQENPLKIIPYNIWNGYDWGEDEECSNRVNTCI
jgi:hypothetical protein